MIFFPESSNLDVDAFSLLLSTLHERFTTKKSPHLLFLIEESSCVTHESILFLGSQSFSLLSFFPWKERSSWISSRVDVFLNVFLFFIVLFIDFLLLLDKGLFTLTFPNTSFFLRLFVSQTPLERQIRRQNVNDDMRHFSHTHGMSRLRSPLNEFTWVSIVRQSRGQLKLFLKWKEHHHQPHHFDGSTSTTSS